MQTLTTKALNQLLNRLSLEPTNEAYLADCLGLTRKEVRNRLTVLQEKGLAIELEENPGHWLKYAAMLLSDEEIHSAVSAYGSLGVNIFVLSDRFDLGIQEMRDRLRKMEAGGLLKSRDGGDEWFLPPPEPILEGEVIPDQAEEKDAPLTSDEKQLLQRLERDIEQSFQKAGLALARIRDERLYRDRFRDFESYCRQRFGISKSYAHRQINAVRIVEEIAVALDDDSEKVSPMGTKNQSTTTTHTAIPLPTSERQVRPLSTLLGSDRVEAWKHAVEVSGGRVPTEQTVKESVQQIKQEVAMRIQPNPYEEGEVVLWGNQWAIVGEVTERTCVCGTFSGYEQVHYCDLQRSDYNDEQSDFLRQYQPLLNDAWQSATNLPKSDQRLIQSCIRALAGSMAIGELSNCASQIFDLVQILAAEQ